ncbi:imidazole glycerol phosphate synthase subunit HisH [Rappaport israeli]|uniref:imidazole glycerol phosphate synthase subunit HisH n=1 Tax=Rappaport israeli TaxID=1839807 RepID=UPI000A5E7E3F
MAMKLVIIDTGCANLASVQFALQRLGYAPVISADKQVIAEADKLLLPGVGTAAFAMRNLQARDLISLIVNASQPMLGICLGMQLLTRASNESGEVGVKNEWVETLGCVEATTQRLPDYELPLPHMGWNQLEIVREHALFEGIKSGAYVYFVHSYAVAVGDYTLASCVYGAPFSAVIARDNFYGMQFHPEKSGAVGAKLLRNFVENVK